VVQITTNIFHATSPHASRPQNLYPISLLPSKAWMLVYLATIHSQAVEEDTGDEPALPFIMQAQSSWWHWENPLKWPACGTRGVEPRGPEKGEGHGEVDGRWCGGGGACKEDDRGVTHAPEVDFFVNSHQPRVHRGGGHYRDFAHIFFLSPPIFW
jgi:hypothetical protein